MESTTHGDSLVVKRTGGACLEFLKEPARELPISKQHINYFSISNTLKGTVKAHAVEILKINTLRCTTTTFFTPQRYDEHCEDPPPPTL